MSTAIKSKNVDLDSIFDPYQQGTSPGLTGIKRAGVDINTRYAPLVYGIQAPATGILCKVGGAGSFVDLNTLFAKYGSAQYNLPIDGKSYGANESTGSSGSAQARITFTISGDGTYSIVQYQSRHTPSSVTLATGTWNNYGLAASAFQVLFTLTQISHEGNTSTSNDAPSYTTISGSLSAYVNAFAATPQVGSNNATYSLRIQIKQISTGQVVSDSTITIAAGAEGGAS